MAEPLPWLLPQRRSGCRCAEARISPLDRSFLFGDGIYEVMPVYGGRLFRFAPHFDRLARSLRRLRMRNPHDAAQWQALLRELVAANGGGDQYVYLQVSRGAEYGRNHAPLPDMPPTVFAYCSPWPRAVAAARSSDGIACITAAGHALGALRHQVRGAAGERAAAPAGGGCRRRTRPSCCATAS